MIDRKKLMELLLEPESDRIERTVSFRPDKLGEAVCAFANDLADHRKPGYLLLNVNDDGSISNHKITDANLQKIGDIRSNGNILPQPLIVVSEVFTLPEGEVVVVEVHPADYPPVRYNGKTCIRISARKDVASPQEERVLIEKRSRHNKTFDQRSCFGSSIRDLSLELFKLTYLPKAIDSETLEVNGRSTEEQLASLGFFDPDSGCCSYAGILLFGKNPLFYLPGAYIQYVKFAGNDMTSEVLQEKVLSGPLVYLLKGITDFIDVNIIKEKPVRGPGFQDIKRANYSRWALRELVMNAIMHRNYESNAPIYIYEFANRLNILNPGGLYGEVTLENFPVASDYRNPQIAGALKNLGYVNRFNFGVSNAQNELVLNGNPEAIFDFSLITKFSVWITDTGENYG